MSGLKRQSTFNNDKTFTDLQNDMNDFDFPTTPDSSIN